jgi:3-keto-disaccharide hydrolase
VRLNTRIRLRLAAGAGILAVFAAVLTVCGAEQPQAEKPSGDSKCFVCHANLRTEALTTSHLAAGITCDVCHGPSVEHMHDEMKMTKPDLLYGRAEVRKLCSKCHKPRDGHPYYERQDHKNPAAVEAFIKEWRGRMRPNGRTVNINSVCTDCHGTHNIVKPANTEAEAEKTAKWVAAFNGRDLAGWQPSGSATWNVKGGRIDVTAPTTGRGSTLWSEATYQDYLLAVTFRATWPIHAGVWLRGDGSQQGPRVQIGSFGRAFTGSVWIPRKGIVLLNIRKDLVDRESWNTLSIQVEGDKVQVWLNAEEIGAVRVPGPAKGKIGLFIAKSSGTEPAELTVREVQVKRLTAPTEKADTPSQS